MNPPPSLLNGWGKNLKKTNRDFFIQRVPHAREGQASTFSQLTAPCRAASRGPCGHHVWPSGQVLARPKNVRHNFFEKGSKMAFPFIVNTVRMPLASMKQGKCSVMCVCQAPLPELSRTRMPFLILILPLLIPVFSISSMSKENEEKKVDPKKS